VATIRNKAQKSRFAITGAIATTIDFGILLGLNALGVNSIAANYVSTTTAFCFSFFANRHFTFKATDGHVGKQMLMFVAVTLFGIWVLQPPIIFLSEKVIEQYVSLPSWVLLVLGKLAATLVTLVWNYYLYSRVVFKTPNADSHLEDE
jgi:putative flippase GtrA